MLRKISPQKVLDDSGYIVQTKDKNTVEYIDNYCVANVDVDFGLSVGLYEASLRIFDKSGNELHLSSTQKTSILEKIVLGIEAMGSCVEIC